MITVQKSRDIPKQELEEIVKNATCFTEILPLIGLSNKGHNNTTLKKRLDFEGINYEHILDKRNYHKKYKSSIPLSDILVENSSYNRTHLKKRLIDTHLLENKCSICEMVPFWEGKSLVLILDHINGISNDNRLENLRLVCPNCNSQLDTHAGRNLKILKRIRKKQKKKYSKELKICPICGKDHYNKICSSRDCYRKYSSKCERPTKEELTNLLESKSIRAIGIMFGVSDNSVRKWLKNG